ncbi:MAG: rRNA maturation RNase YbeY [Candidatus Niyogibacteria bacterium]|nr:rRNA maturation RNase YbeY [Candidatus Niyogibacteria bacterium]
MVSLVNLTKQKTPIIAWKKIAEKILGKQFDLSVVLTGEKKIAAIKKKYLPRKQELRRPNILSFLMEENVGEIFLCPAYLRREAPFFKRNFNRHLKKIYLHGILHLKGFSHQQEKEAVKMAKEEKKWEKIL